MVARRQSSAEFCSYKQSAARHTKLRDGCRAMVKMTRKNLGGSTKNMHYSDYGQVS